MTNKTVLPHIEPCLELCQVVYDEHGTKPFTPDQLDWRPSDLTVRRLLEFGVAYGLFSFDGTTYQLHCGLDATDDQWEAAFHDRAAQTRQTLRDRFDPGDRTGAGNTAPAGLTHDGADFASVFVEKSDDFAAVADAVGNVDLSEWNGVVLRSPGDYASEVQRFADRFDDQSDVTNLPVSKPLQKIYSDVTGTEKDALEFRLYLKTA